MHTFNYRLRCFKKEFETKYPLIFNEIKLCKRKTSNWPPITVVKKLHCFFKVALFKLSNLLCMQ